MFDDISVGITFVMKNYEETKGKISGIQNALDGVGKTKVEKPIKEASKHTSNFNNNIKKVVTNVKKLGFALLTVRGIWFAIRKAMTTYLSQNDELKNKLDAIYYALGSLFSPILESMVEWLIKGIAYIDVLAKALGFAGINMTNFGKSSEKTKNSLAGFDEINNIGDKNSSSSGIANPFSNIKLNPKIVSALQKIGEFLKPIIDRIREMDLEDVLETIALIIAAYSAWKLATSLLSGAFSNKNKTLETQNGLESAALLALPALAAAYYAVKNSVSSLADAFDRLKQGETSSALSEVTAATESMAEGTENSLTNSATSFENWKEKIKVVLGEIILEIILWKEKASSKINELISNTKQSFASWSSSIKENVSDWASKTSSNVDSWKTSMINSIGVWATNFVAILSGALSASGTNLNDWFETTYSNLTSWVKNTVSNIGSWANSIAETVGNALESAWESFKSFKEATGEKISGWFSKGKTVFTTSVALVGLTLSAISLKKSLKSLPSYDVGTNYVPNDMVAQLHQGEAVVPKEFNPSAFYGQNTAEELNLLAAINENLERLYSKDTTINLDGNNVAQAINNRIQDLKYRNGERAFAIAR